jgi:hypothetical protein
MPRAIEARVKSTFLVVDVIVVVVVAVAVAVV